MHKKPVVDNKFYHKSLIFSCYL